MWTPDINIEGKGWPALVLILLAAYGFVMAVSNIADILIG